MLLPNDKRWEDMVDKPVKVCQLLGADMFSDYVYKVVKKDGYYDLWLYYTHRIQPTNVSNAWWVEMENYG